MYETILPARLESEENEKIEEEKIIEENEKARKLLNEESEKIEEEYEYPLGDIARMNVAIDHMFNNISLLLSQNMTNCSKDLSPKVTLEKITILKYRYAEYLF